MVALPTSPLRTHKDIDKAIDIFKSKKAESLISCCRVSHPYDWAFSSNINMKINYKNLRKKIILIDKIFPKNLFQTARYIF